MVASVLTRLGEDLELQRSPARGFACALEADVGKHLERMARGVQHKGDQRMEDGGVPLVDIVLETVHPPHLSNVGVWDAGRTSIRNVEASGYGFFRGSEVSILLICGDSSVCIGASLTVGTVASRISNALKHLDSAAHGVADLTAILLGDDNVLEQRALVAACLSAVSRLAREVLPEEVAAAGAR